MPFNGENIVSVQTQGVPGKASVQSLYVYFLNIRVSQMTKRIQDLQKDGDTARLYRYTHK